VLQLGDGSVRRLPNQTSAVVDVAFLAQEGLRTLADDRSVSTWAPGGDAGYRLLDTSGGLNEGTVGRFSADGRRLVLLGAQAADVEDVTTGASLLRQTSIDHALGLADLAASSSGVVVVAADGSMSLLDWQGTGATAAEAAPAVAPAPLAAVGASRNGNHVATVAADGVVRLLDRAGRILRSTTATSLGLSLDDVINEASATTDAEGGWVDRGPALAVSDDGDVVTIGATTAIVSWLSSPGASPRYAVPQGARVTAMGLSPDGSYVAAGLDLSAVPQARGDNGVYLWDATSGELVTGQVLRDDITAIEFTPDGSLIMIGTDAGELRVLDTATADARLVPRYADLDGAVISIASSPDLLAVATPDSLLLFAWEEFDYATSEDPVDAYREVNLFPAEAAFVDVAFDETGSNLMAVEADGFAYVVEDVGSPVDLQWAVERAEQLIAENDADGA
jgi:WD40 repeat protein